MDAGEGPWAPGAKNYLGKLFASLRNLIFSFSYGSLYWVEERLDSSIFDGS